MRVDFSPDFGIDASELEVKAVEGMSKSIPKAKVLSSSVIEIDNGKGLTKGIKVEFKVSSIRMPRYGGAVQESVTIQLLEGSTG